MAEIDARLKELEKHLHMRGADIIAPSNPVVAAETSPHAWSRSKPKALVWLRNRNISTCVEQMACRHRDSLRTWKHLHMRGADKIKFLNVKTMQETSPHAWSRYFSDCLHYPQARNISTCVEQIRFVDNFPTFYGKHLHMRGADLVRYVGQTVQKETSPHAWSRWNINLNATLSRRNISTCVEQIFKLCDHFFIRQKHLHMRGADIESLRAYQLNLETSPHAWSRSRGVLSLPACFRNISTCVEQIFFVIHSIVEAWKHLHMRGADLIQNSKAKQTRETSPHAWSRSPQKTYDPHDEETSPHAWSR